MDEDPAARPSPEVIDSIEQSFARLSVLVKTALREAAASLGVDVQPAAWNVLRYVMRNAPTQASAIATSIGMDKSAVSRHLKDLREHGLVTVEHSASDARAVLIAPTPEAVERVGLVTDSWRGRFRDILGTWDDEELEAFALLLERFAASDPWVVPASD